MGEMQNHPSVLDILKLGSLYDMLSNNNYEIITSHFDDHTSTGRQYGSILRSPSFSLVLVRFYIYFQYLLLPPIQSKLNV